MATADRATVLSYDARNAKSFRSTMTATGSTKSASCGDRAAVIMDSDNGTIGALIDNGYRIVVYCEARPCRHYAELDLTAFGKRFGLASGGLAKDILPKLHCSKCGSKALSLRMTPKRTQDRSG
jgi:hypothetical protein